jgi:tRNA pseudouridine55 synthase
MDGALIIDKPEGLTSHDVVACVRRAASTRRVGHAGTLDPFATGVLVVCIGRATRLVQYIVGSDKEYTARVKLGYATDTQDLTGKPTAPLISSHELSEEDVRRVLTEFTGPQLQVPPMYSAKKVGGERLHRAARAGREVARKAVPVVIRSLSLAGSGDHPYELNEDGTLEFEFDVACSSGTYIRTLAHDIGRRLGVGGHLVALRRRRAGRFDLSQSVTLDDVVERGRECRLDTLIIPPSDVIGHMHAVRLDRRGVVMVANGRAVEAGPGVFEGSDGPARLVRLLDEEGALVAVGEFDGSLRVIRPRAVFCESSRN